jgi:hypothetical protein
MSAIKSYYSGTIHGPTSTTTRFLEYYNSRYKDYSTVKEAFMRTPMSSSKHNAAHSHPTGAKGRTDAINTMQTIVAITGHIEYVIQPRPSDVQRGKPGRSQYFWGKDTRVPAMHDDITHDHAITITDTDYYMNMPQQLQHFNLHLLYTMTPTQASATSVANTSYTFEGDEIVSHICGGATYRHRLWNYSGDTLTVMFWRYGVYPVLQQFAIERRSVNLTHSIVALIPLNRWTGLAALVASRVLEHSHLERMNPAVGDYTIIRTISQSTDLISISRQGDYTAATIDTTSFEELSNLQRHSKVGLTATAIKTKMAKETTNPQVTVLLSYIRENIPRKTSSFYRNYKVEYAVQTYHLFPDTYSPDQKRSLTAFMFPLFNGSYSPSNTLGSAIAAIDGRVNNLKQIKLMTQQHYYYMSKFLQYLVPNDIAFTYCPVDEDYILDKQTRPTQVRTLYEAFDQEVRKPFQSIFVKKESYGKIADPRVITTERPADKLEYCAYQYSISAFMKTQPWYAFGLTPIEIADRVAQIAQASETINCTDFSRMDGRKTLVTRTLNYLFMKRLFAREYHEDILRILQSKINVFASSPEFDGEVYRFNAELAQGSGLPDTSNFNSLDNAFNNFLGYYFQYKSFDVAWEKLNELVILGGDDTVAGDLEHTSIVEASTSLGHVITSDIYKRGEPGVNFLARQYGPDLWNGEMNSCTDIMRCLSKLHTTVTLPPTVTAAEKLSQKLTSLAFTDRNSPLIEDLISKFLKVGGKIAERDQWQIQSFWSQYPPEVQYPNFSEEWMFDLLPPGINYTEFYDYLEKCTSVYDLMSLRLIMEKDPTPHAQQVVVDIDGDDTLVGDDSTRLSQPDQTLPLPQPLALKLRSNSLPATLASSRSFSTDSTHHLRIKSYYSSDPNKKKRLRKPFVQKIPAALVYQALEIASNWLGEDIPIARSTQSGSPPDPDV